MLKKLVLAVVVLLIGFSAIVHFQPSDYKISREVAIKGTPDLIFPFLINSQIMNDWMPWKESDPQIQMTYSGPESGVGSVASWESPGKMGTGKSEIIEIIENQKVITKISYYKPMEFTQESEFLLNTDGVETTVRWTVIGTNNFVSKMMSLFFDMDKYVGGEFKKGLDKLRVTVDRSRIPNK